jgi:pimeloyl-ACP methyl ester carboxylesterase
MVSHTHYKFKQVKDLNIFYREAGNPSAPHILLLHGFPTSSHQYRNLIPLLAAKYHVLAPDLPGFGLTEVPDGVKFKYTFENFAKVVGEFLDTLKIKEFAIYLFDYGAPTGFRLALTRPDLKIQAIISQNGNAYDEGLGDFWAPIQKYWADNAPQSREAIRPFLDLESVKYQYETGVPKAKLQLIEPEAYHLDHSFMARPGNKDIQLDIFYDYRTNVSLYPQFQKWIRESKVPVWAGWGKHDPIFVPPGAEAFKRDSPSAFVKLYDCGHFALETDLDEISKDILTFLKGFYGH